MQKIYISLIVVLTLLSTNGFLFGQQTPIFHSYALSPELYNPARIGEDGGGKLFFSHRQQWVSIDDAPSSQLFSFSYRLSNDSPLALGIVLKNDKAGLLKRTDAAVFSGYHMGNDFNQFSAGIYLGFNSMGVAFSEINVFENTAILQEGRKVKLDAGIGINFRHRNENSTLHIGLASHQLPGTFEYSQDSVSGLSLSLVNHIMATVSWKYKVNDQVSIEPIVMYRTLPGQKKLKGGALDLHFRVHLGRLGVGLGIRPDAGNIFGTVNVLLDDEKRSGLMGVADQTRDLGLGYEVAGWLGLGEKIDPDFTPVIKEPIKTDPNPISDQGQKTRNAFWTSTPTLYGRLAKAGLTSFASIKSVNGLNGTTITVSYVDESTNYHLQESRNKQLLIAWLNNLIKEAQGPNVPPFVDRIDSLVLLTQFKEPLSRVETYSAEIPYSGDWGEVITDNYHLDGEAKEIRLTKSSKLLSIPQLSFLQLYDIRKELTNGINLNASDVKVKLEFEKNLDSSQETQIQIFLPKQE